MKEKDLPNKFTCKFRTLNHLTRRPADSQRPLPLGQIGPQKEQTSASRDVTKLQRTHLAIPSDAVVRPLFISGAAYRACRTGPLNYKRASFRAVCLSQWRSIHCSQRLPVRWLTRLREKIQTDKRLKRRLI